MPDHRPSPLDQRMDQLFTEQAERTPDAPALVHGEQRLTYGELLDRARGVAGRLRSLGVEDETLVALAFPRSVDAVVAMLGVVLARGAYLPVNPAFPAERIARLLDDARPPLVLCGPGTPGDLAGAVPDGTRLLELGELEALTAAAPPDAPGEPGDGSPLAYVMYTSGSTGRPKGVMVEHAGVVRLVRDADWFDFSDRHRFLLTGALEFDAATFEIWGALLNGAVLHLVDQDVLLTPARLKAALREAGTTVLWLTAPLFNQLVDEDPTLFAGLETLLVGGDVLSCRHIALLRAACPRLRVLNGYGPTENTTFTTVFPVERDYRTAIPIGRPVSGTTVQVLDAEGRPVAPGQVGELYTAGRGLARGYLGRPDLTAERFVTIGGTLHYRTGDLVSAGTDGVLSFHGRTDDQVKIRGHRVEVKEVTTALLETDGVRDAHTVVTGDGTGAGDGTGRRLVAYAVLDGPADEDSVRAALRRALPGYLVPDRVVAVPALPLNANGKVDTARLPRPTAREDHREPPVRTALEDRVAGLWADVLHLDAGTIHPDDDFFDLGGTSITAGALAGRIHRATGVALPLARLFAARTLAAVAREVAATEPTELAPLPHDPGRRTSALHPQQRALYALWRTDPSSTAYNIPFRLDVAPGLDAGRLAAALGELVARHDALRTGFRLDADEVRQVHAPTADVTVATAGADEVPTDAEALERLVRPFDLERPPLLRALLVPGTDGDRLYLDAHHIVFDGMSLAVLVEDLLDLYAGTAPPPLPTGYGDASQWFADRLGSGALDPAERYWLDVFAEPPAPLGVRPDRPRPPVRPTRGGVVRRPLGAARGDAVRDSASRHGVTAFGVLLTAYAAALGRITGQRDLVVGCPMSGRAHPDLDRLVGMFVNTVPLRLRLTDEDRFADVLRRAAGRHQEALCHQDYPFERLVRQVVTERDPSRNPLFDAFFALQNIGFHRFRAHGRRVEVSLLHQGTCRFDLNLQAYERPDGTVLELEYATDLFDPSSAEFLLDRVVAALDELLHHPDRPVFPPAAPPAPAAPAATAATFAF
ncbi:non-ribosomal peptide synthetase [Streptomyces ficellus]|uniref:Amino acid adenylation domain-containing protein n=1 Tax=Streptomyces ficellus TaxID=1977088 RepID=A0A6I6FR93_9ACTN|nr:non-ribosomal peptide synthetase [Streptomyces ficellus]QGV80138.1 amino acid adenylation domain-containing protein [Streptomyces ficellus]